MSLDATADPTLVREITAWLGGDASRDDTVAAAPRSTIIPTLARPRSDTTDVAALLAALGEGDALHTGVTLGEGGMGVVRLAEQAALARTVAVKTLKPGRHDPAAALDLLREAWVTGALEHPSIVPVHALYRDADGSPAIVMKRVAGVEWSELCDDADAVAARFGADDLLTWNLEILIAVLHALRFAHARDIVHRDLKPSNVMIGEFGEVYLLDWGLAVTVGDDRGGRLPRADRATALAGTPCYMAPEMLGPEHGGPITTRTDVYLAGAVLFELIAGAPPHDGATAAAVIASVLTSQPRLPADAPAELAAICQRAMAPASDHRYPTVAELQRDLQAFVRHRGATRLTARAERRLVELIELAGRRGGDVAGQRDGVYRLLGACRFGFHEALVAWPDDAAAQRGLAAATCAAAEFELAVDDPRAALALLAELAAPPAELRARAEQALAHQRRRQAALEEVHRLHDAGTGTRTRTFIAAVLGTVWTAATLGMALAPSQIPHHTYAGAIGYSVALLLVVVGFAVWARESMMKTRVNQRAVALAIVVFVSQGGMFAVGWRLGLPLAAAEVLMILGWLTVAATAVIAVDAWLWPTVLANVAGLAIALGWPDARYFAMAGINAVFTVNAVLRWRPAAPRTAPPGSPGPVPGGAPA